MKQRIKPVPVPEQPTQAIAGLAGAIVWDIISHDNNSVSN